MAGEVREIRAEHVPGMLGSVSVAEREIVLNAAANSRPLWGGFWNGETLCIFGLIPPTLLSEQAYLWLHTTEAASEHEFVLVRRSQIEVRKMLEEHPRIIGHCEVGAERSIRWLRWLGAVFGEPQGKLIPFVIRGKDATDLIN